MLLMNQQRCIGKLCFITLPMLEFHVSNSKSKHKGLINKTIKDCHWSQSGDHIGQAQSGVVVISTCYIQMCHSIFAGIVFTNREGGEEGRKENHTPPPPPTFSNRSIRIMEINGDTRSKPCVIGYWKCCDSIFSTTEMQAFAESTTGINYTKSESAEPYIQWCHNEDVLLARPWIPSNPTAELTRTCKTDGKSSQAPPPPQHSVTIPLNL